MRFLSNSSPIRVYPDNSGALVVQTPYSQSFVADLKRLPAADRRFDPMRKAWLVTADHATEIEDLVRRHFFETIHVTAPAVNAVPEMRVLDVRYIGQAKDRGKGDRTAYGWMDRGWNAIFTEHALRVWFEGEDSQPSDDTTLYGVLGIKTKADDTEIKTAYRRMAKQYHPDLYHEPDAGERFRAIQHAYEVLSDYLLKRRYDVGLKMAGEMPVEKSGMADILIDGYRSPLRCGLILAEGLPKLGKFSVSKITQWADIQNSKGQMLISSWPMGADEPEENWA